MGMIDMSRATARAREFFTQRPGATVDEAARVLAADRMGLHKGLLVRLRREARESRPPLTPLVLRTEAAPPPVEPQPAAPTPPPEETPVPEAKRSAKQPPPNKAPQPVPMLLVPPEDLEVGRAPTQPGKAMRIRYLNILVEKHPGLTTTTYQRALKEVFGMGLDTGYAGDVVRIAREVQSYEAAKAKPTAPPLPPKPTPAPRPVALEAAPPPPPAPVAISDFDFDQALRALGAAVRQLCEQHHVASARLTWDGATVHAEVSRRVSSNFEL